MSDTSPSKEETKTASPVGSPEASDADANIDAGYIAMVSQKVLDLQEEAARIEQMVKETQTATKSHPTPVEKKSADERSVFVGNVDYITTPEELQTLFSPCGIIERVTILSDSYTKQPKGFAYVEFKDKASVANALELNETSLHNRPIKVVTKRSNYPGMGQRRRRRGRRRRSPAYHYQPY